MVVILTTVSQPSKAVSLTIKLSIAVVKSATKSVKFSSSCGGTIKPSIVMLVIDVNVPIKVGKPDGTRETVGDSVGVLDTDGNADMDISEGDVLRELLGVDVGKEELGDALGGDVGDTVSTTPLSAEVFITVKSPYWDVNSSDSRTVVTSSKLKAVEMSS